MQFPSASIARTRKNRGFAPHNHVRRKDSSVASNFRPVYRPNSPPSEGFPECTGIRTYAARTRSSIFHKPLELFATALETSIT